MDTERGVEMVDPGVMDMSVMQSLENKVTWYMFSSWLFL